MKRTKYTIRVEGETARFSDVRHALLFAIMISERLPHHFIEVGGQDGLVGQYHGGITTPEFEQHHRSVFPTPFPGTSPADFTIGQRTTPHGR